LATNWRKFRPKFKELWFVDVTYTDSQGHEQKGVRPCLIIREFQAGDMGFNYSIYKGSVSITLSVHGKNRKK